MQYYKHSKTLFIIVASLLLGACGGGGSSSNSTPPPGGGTNSAPVISGNPAKSIASGSNYSFTPSASDADGDSLTFSASNLPAWASFNSDTGTISGTPTDNDQGTYNNIVVTVSDGTATSSLSSFSINVTVIINPNGTVDLSWTAPTTYSDGTNLSLSNIGGYRIYIGPSAGSLSQVADLPGASNTQYTFSNLAPGNYVIAIATYDSNNIEGNQSTVTITI